jgi:phage/plasmid-associated DNA primase
MNSKMIDTIEDIIKAYFVKEHNNGLVNCYIPIDVDKKTDLRNNLSIDELQTLWETGKVSYKNNKGQTMTYKKPTENINGYSLFYKHIDAPLYCLDIDGIWCEKHYHDQDNKKDISECSDCIERRENARDTVEQEISFVADFPYTLSKTKKLPHFICHIEGMPEYKQEVKVLNDCHCIEADLIKFDRTITERKGNTVYNWDKDESTILTYHWNDISKYFNVERMGIKSDTVTPTVEVKKNFESSANIHKKYYDLAMCCNLKRFSEYTGWFELACILKSIEDSDEMFEVFDEISSKSKKYTGTQDCYKQWENCNSQGLTVGTLRRNAKYDNPADYNQWYEKYIINSIETLVKDYDFHNLAKYFYNLKPNNYIVKGNGKNKLWHILQENQSWLSSDTHDGLLTDLTETIKAEIKEYIHFLPLDNPNVLKAIQAGKNIGNNADKCFKFLIELYSNNTVKFDDKWQLFGFNNQVLDLETCKFRPYKYDDYISIKTGYDWREPTKEEINTVMGLIKQIIPEKDRRDFLLQLYSTGLEGRTLEKFIVLNGSGGNGKGLLDDILLKAFGDYGFLLDNGVLTKPLESGADPKAYKMKNKRFVICREPKASRKLCNATIKDITGGSTIPVRDLYNSNCETPICPTLFMECNEKPSFEEAPKNSEARRIIDIEFASSFVDDPDDVDIENHIYQANSIYKTSEWQEKHKFAFISILMDAYKTYKANNYNLVMPKTIKERTEKYLQTSFDVFAWFEENYTPIDKFVMPKINKDRITCIEAGQYIKLSDLYSEYKLSEQYKGLDKNEKATMTKERFTNSFMKNPYYAKRCINVDIKVDDNKRYRLRECVFGYDKSTNPDDDE